MKKLFAIGLFAALVSGIVRLVSTQKAAWQGLSESEIRTKLHDKLDTKIAAEKVDEMADKIVEGMRKSGNLGAEAPGEA
jgi:hypothetical protein